MYLYYNESKSMSCLSPPFFALITICMFTHPPKDWKEEKRRGKWWKETEREAIQDLASPSYVGSHDRYGRVYNALQFFSTVQLIFHACLSVLLFVRRVSRSGTSVILPSIFASFIKTCFNIDNSRIRWIICKIT